mgnify:CR=1 FL=1
MTVQRVNKILLIALLSVCAIWLIIPFTMAVLWSLVDPSEPWTADKVLPPVMSLFRWTDMWENSSLKSALIASYTLAPSAAVLSLLLALPTAFCVGPHIFSGPRIGKDAVLAAFGGASLYHGNLFHVTSVSNWLVQLAARSHPFCPLGSIHAVCYSHPDRQL